MHFRSPDQGGLPLGGVCIQWGGSASRGRGLHPGSWANSPGLPTGVWADPPLRDTWDTTGYGQQAGGTHPTGMYSCFQDMIKKQSFNLTKLFFMQLHLR